MHADADAVVDHSARVWLQVPPMGKGSLYIRPLLLGSGPILGLGPAPSYTFTIFAAAVGAYFKGGQLTPIDLIVEERFHRAAPGGMGGTKAAGNYSPVSLGGRAAGRAHGSRGGGHQRQRRRAVALRLACRHLMRAGVCQACALGGVRLPIAHTHVLSAVPALKRPPFPGRGGPGACSGRSVRTSPHARASIMRHSPRPHAWLGLPLTTIRSRTPFGWRAARRCW